MPSSASDGAYDLDAATQDLRVSADALVSGGVAPGAAFLLRAGDETRVGALGTRDARDPMTGTTRFAIGSVTKTVVATAALQLVEDGTLTLDDTVQQWLPGLLPERPLVTVEHLLRHRSGLFNVTDIPDVELDGSTPGDLIALAVDRPRRFAPGADGEYSNTGYLVLGLLLEKAADQTLGLLLRERVLEPAGMQHTTLPQDYPTDAAHGHEYGEDVTPPTVGWAGGAGGVVSTVGDLDRFLRALYDGTLLSEQSLQSMRSMRPLGPDGSWAYGLGLASRELSCGTAEGHDGSIFGIGTEAWTLSGSERSVVLVLNGDPETNNAQALTDTALCG